MKIKKEKINTVLITTDFTLQNVALKIGIPIKGIDNLEITKLRYYILKCYSCSTFIFETDKMFCPECGYNTLMKIGYSVNSKGKIKIYDKKAETRIRGTQFDLPKPSLSKKGTVFILSEDQIPKKRVDKNILDNLDKILDSYEC